MKYLVSLLILSSSLIAKENQQVILIHGLMNPYSMRSLQSSLNQNDYDITDWSYPTRSKTIKENGHNLALYLRNLPPSKKPIHFVAFSLGGLVLQEALMHPECPENAKRGKITLISSPINGSKLARFIGKFRIGRLLLGYDGGGKDLYSTSSKEFTEKCTFPKTARILVISGTFGFNPVFEGNNDGKVAVSETCIDAPHLHKYIHAGHSWICHYPDTISEVLTFLNDSSGEICYNKQCESLTKLNTHL